MNTTYVTCFVKLYENEPYEHKTLNWRIQQFEKILKTGVNIYLFVDTHTFPLIESLLSEYSNHLFVDSILNLSEEYVQRMNSAINYKLPTERNISKDTFQYFKCMHGKIECVAEAIRKNPFKTLYFGWVDFSMAYLFSNPSTVQLLQTIQNTIQEKESCIYIPGCWSKFNIEHPHSIIDKIHWRFCGTFWIGDIPSIKIFHEEYIKKWVKFHLLTNSTFTWEVNYWAWLEVECPSIKFKWYESDHNDRLLTSNPLLYPLIV